MWFVLKFFKYRSAMCFMAVSFGPSASRHEADPKQTRSQDIAEGTSNKLVTPFFVTLKLGNVEVYSSIIRSSIG